MTDGKTQPGFAYLSNGRLWAQQSGGMAREIHSPFVRELAERAERMQQKNSWKGGGDGGLFGMPRQTMWGGDGGSDHLERARLTSLSAGPDPDSVFYFVETGMVGGLFRYDLAENEELRIFHRETFSGIDLRYGAGAEQFAASLQLPNGTASLMLLNKEGRNAEDITEGDSLDAGPSFSAQDPEVIVFHSAGVARTADGYAVGLGPARVERLDLRNGEAATLCESPEHDYLLPRLDGEGNLWALKRPYRGPGNRKVSPFGLLKDIVYFPFRLLRAFGHFLNVFSMMFSKKPLFTAGGPAREHEKDLREVWLRGQLVEVDKKLAKGGKDELSAGALVPSSWQLVRIGGDRGEDVVARHVVAYDLGPDGRALYTNGRGIFAVSPGSKPKKLGSGDLVSDLCWIASG